MMNEVLWTANDEVVNAELLRETTSGWWVLNLDGMGIRGYPTIGLTREDIERLRDTLDKELSENK